MHFDHILEAQQFDASWLIREFFPLADEMAKIVESGNRCDDLHGKSMVSFFYESSTRTRASHEFAMWWLGGTVVFSTENASEFSSVVKGETLANTICVLNRYRPNVIVLRHHEEGAAKIAAQFSRVPIINAGDGTGQHPTQALLDIYTIYKRFGHIDGIKIAIVGDLKNGRTVRSLAYLLGKFPGVVIYFVAPASSGVREDIKDYLRRHNTTFSEETDLREVAPVVDVVYQTRTQKERGSILDRSDPTQGYFVVDDSILALMRANAAILHPLPKLDEITPSVDRDPRAAYLTDQIDAGLFTRMALLKTLLLP
ncbi:MAG: aspartate carbamoyltransferase [Candidatus Staskawiczbacteria bacterium]|jgi:aspartate carbamoyltransferase catalytic subunit